MSEVIRRNVALRKREFETVQAFGEAHGLDFSSALRFIINEWARQREAAGDDDAGVAPPSAGAAGAEAEGAMVMRASAPQAAPEL